FASPHCQIAPAVPPSCCTLTGLLQEIGGADMVIMLQPFIVYHLFQNCQGILCGNLRYKGISSLQKKYLAQVTPVTVSWRYYYAEQKRDCVTVGALLEAPLQAIKVTLSINNQIEPRGEVCGD
ncbi:MAG: hypothetical protein Q8L00_05960, partial [Deltaproteobacteria bacterium]|nr:hypothetical protein [Deltaproteobacteria bacterium]